MKRKKNYLLYIMISILIIRFAFIPIPIDKSYDAISFIIGEDSYDHIEVRIDGWIYYRLFQDNQINYEFYLDGKKYPLDKHKKFMLQNEWRMNPLSKERAVLIEQPIDKEEHKGCRYLSFDIEYPYYVPGANTLEREKVGMLFTTWRYEDLIIGVFEENGWSSSEGHRIIVTKENIEEAEAYAMELMHMDISGE